MINHKVCARHSRVKVNDRLSIPLIKFCIRNSLRLEEVDIPCEISVLITDDAGIREMNRIYRGVDQPTDVLSFPMLEFSSPGWSYVGVYTPDPDTELLPLGEIAISAQRVIEQSRRFGQSREKETAYLVVHSVLHLLGYDHIDEAEGKKMMREREKFILGDIEL